MCTLPVSAPDRQETEFYCWSFPGSPLEIQLSLKVIDDLRHFLRQASSSTANFVRGLLLGTNASHGLTRITDFQALHTGNRGELEEALATIGKSGDNPIPVGYFRSADSLTLSPEDVWLAETYFSDPRNAFLVIRASGVEASDAGFFFWDCEKLNCGFHDFCFLTFPFDRTALAAPGQNRVRIDVQPTPPDGTDVPRQCESHALAGDPPANTQAANSNMGVAPKSRQGWGFVRLALSAVILSIVGFLAGVLVTQSIVNSTTKLVPPPLPQLADRLSPATAEYVPALPIQQSIPSLTRAQRESVSATVEIKVKVSIDESGNVRKAESLTTADPILNTAAQSAAMQWKFQPARRAGKDIPSEMILRFRFDSVQ